MCSSYQVWAFGRLSVFASIKWMVNSLGPAAPVEPYRQTFQLMHFNKASFLHTDFATYVKAREKITVPAANKVMAQAESVDQSAADEGMAEAIGLLTTTCRPVFWKAAKFYINKVAPSKMNRIKHRKVLIVNQKQVLSFGTSVYCQPTDGTLSGESQQPRTLPPRLMIKPTTLKHLF